jgi:hypothetical protein
LQGVAFMNWISVKENPPEIGQWCLIFIECEYNEKKFHVGKYEGFSESFEVGHCPGDYYGECSKNSKFWMPLPESPS